MFKLLLYIFIFSISSLNAQEKTELIFHFQSNEIIPNNIKPKIVFKKTEKAEQSLSFLIQNLFSEGYIEASIDSTVFQENYLHVYIYVGNQYKLAQLENGNLDRDVIEKINFKDEKHQNINFSFQAIQNLQFKILNYYENRGYPFAEVYLDSIIVENNTIISKIYAKPNLLFIIDSIIIEGNSKTKSKYLQNFLDIKKGDLFNKSKINKISQKIAQLRFVKEFQEIEINFLNGKAEIRVFLNKQKSNQFDLLLGIAPSSSLSKSKINISGNGNLHLLNSFGVGEEIYLDFKQLKPRTQKIDLKFNYPYLLNLPFGVTSEFELFKNDTSFINLNTKAGFHFAFNGADYFQLVYINNTSSILNYDISKVMLSSQLPNMLDLSNNRFGVGVHFQKIDYIFNPRKGYNISLNWSVGLKRIKESNTLKNIDAEIYNDIKLKSTNSTIETGLEYSVPLLKRHSFHISNDSKFFVSKNILENEKFRLGGAKSLRGFDEDEIYTPYYSLFTLEYHFLLSKNTYFYSFGDIAIVEDSKNGSKKVDTPFGFGLGAALETKGGIFSINYALGKQLGNKLEIKRGKIHFGYINLF